MACIVKENARRQARQLFQLRMELASVAELRVGTSAVKGARVLTGFRASIEKEVWRNVRTMDASG